MGPVGTTEGSPGLQPRAEPARRPLVKRHHGIVRFAHWANALLLVGMIASGLQIYTAFPHFGPRGGPYYPNPWDGKPFPQGIRLGGWLAGGLNWHFALAWPFVLTGLVYLLYLVFSGEWRSLLFRPGDVPRAVQMQLYYLRLRKEHPPQGKHNALQKAAYSFIFVLGVLAVFLVPNLIGVSVVQQRADYDKVTSALQYARKAAVARRRYTCVVLSASAATLTIDPNPPESTATPFGGTCPFATALPLPAQDSACSSTNQTCTKTIALSGTPSSFQFDPLGRASTTVTAGSPMREATNAASTVAPARRRGV